VQALLGVEITSSKALWRQVTWLPYVKYLEAAGESAPTVTLPDGRTWAQFGLSVALTAGDIGYS
jgi:hypothetical protein